MKKKYLIILSLVIILLTSIIAFYYFQNKKIIQETPSGQVKMNNPETDKNFKNINETFYYNKSKDYFFAYDKKNNLFSITINSPDIQTVRNTAEKEFIKVLGIKVEDTCKLAIDLRPIGNIISLFKLEDINYGLSFCPNGIAFPK